MTTEKIKNAIIDVIAARKAYLAAEAKFFNVLHNFHAKTEQAIIAVESNPGKFDRKIADAEAERAAAKDNYDESFNVGDEQGMKSALAAIAKAAAKAKKLTEEKEAVIAESARTLANLARTIELDGLDDVRNQITDLEKEAAGDPSRRETFRLTNQVTSIQSQLRKKINELSK